jgi:exodeoxyribonuclease VII large subunit
VADLRAPTPSAAAELVVHRKQDFEERLEQCTNVLVRESHNRIRHERQAVQSLHLRLKSETRNLLYRAQQRTDDAARRTTRLMERRVRDLQQFLQSCRSRLTTANPRNRLKQHTQRIERIRGLLLQRTRDTVHHHRRRMDHLRLVLTHAGRNGARQPAQHLKELETQLQAYSPRAVLERGYSITRTAEGRVLLRAEEIEPGREVETILSKGRIRSKVLDSQPGEDHAQ